MKKQIIIIYLIICLCGINGCGVSQAVEYDDTKTFSTMIEDIKYEKPIIKANSKKTTELLDKAEQIKEAAKEETTPIEEDSAVEELQPMEEVEPQEVYYEDNYINYSNSDNNNYNNDNFRTNDEGDLTQESGVNYYNGRIETYYSSNVLYHQDTDQWTVDEEGFYRTDEGYYVVAASDMPQGTTFEGSKGTCIVLDSGCSENITDYYTNF